MKSIILHFTTREIALNDEEQLITFSTSKKPEKPSLSVGTALTEPETRTVSFGIHKDKF